MIPKYARFHGFNSGEDSDGFHQPVYDADQRKQYVVHLVMPEDEDEPSREPSAEPSTVDIAYEERTYACLDRAKSTLKSIVDKLAPEVTEVRVDLSGEVAPVVTDWSESLPETTYYPKLDEFGLPEASTRTILRSEITELDRLSHHVDAVWHKGMAAGEKAVFKYFHSLQAGFEGWQEINIHARLPPHPNLVPLQRFVLEEISGSRVVGFTMPFIPGAGFDDFDKNTTPCFKLKHLKQLLQVSGQCGHHNREVHLLPTPRGTDNGFFFIYVGRRRSEPRVRHRAPGHRAAKLLHRRHHRFPRRLRLRQRRPRRRRGARRPQRRQGRHPRAARDHHARQCLRAVLAALHGRGAIARPPREVAEAPGREAGRARRGVLRRADGLGGTPPASTGAGRGRAVLAGAAPLRLAEVLRRAASVVVPRQISGSASVELLPCSRRAAGPAFRRVGAPGRGACGSHAAPAGYGTIRGGRGGGRGRGCGAGEWAARAEGEEEGRCRQAGVDGGQRWAACWGRAGR